MSFSYEHKAVIEVYHAIHMAWQMRTFEWSDSWDSINERLKNLRAQHSYTPQPVTFKKNFKCGSCTSKPNGGGNGGGGGGGQSANRQSTAADFINGIPKSYMRAQNLCIKFNSERGCKEQASHKNSSNSEVTLQHFCAGCHKKESKKEPHRAFDCKQGPFKALFRGW